MQIDREAKGKSQNPNPEIHAVAGDLDPRSDQGIRPATAPGTKMVKIRV
jgi:hypothetical protein